MMSDGATLRGCVKTPVPRIILPTRKNTRGMCVRLLLLTVMFVGHGKQGEMHSGTERPLSVPRGGHQCVMLPTI
jgi:hypothetical protein